MSSSRTLRTTFTWYLLQKEFFRVSPSITFLAFPLGVTSKADNLIIGRSADKLAAQRLAAVSAGVALLVVALALKNNVIKLAFWECNSHSFQASKRKVILKTFTAISQILTNLTGDEARLCLPRADDSLVTANALCCLVFCVARLAVDLVEKG